MLILHEVAKSSVEVEQFIEVGSKSVFLGHFIEIINTLIYFSFHEEYYTFCEQSKFLDVGGVQLQMLCPVDMIICTVKISILYFTLGYLYQS